MTALEKQLRDSIAETRRKIAVSRRCPKCSPVGGGYADEILYCPVHGLKVDYLPRYVCECGALPKSYQIYCTECGKEVKTCQT